MALFEVLPEYTRKVKATVLKCQNPNSASTTEPTTVSHAMLLADELKGYWLLGIFRGTQMEEQVARDDNSFPQNSRRRASTPA